MVSFLPKLKFAVLPVNRMTIVRHVTVLCDNANKCTCIYQLSSCAVLLCQIHYRIAGKFGGDFNLADWRIDSKPPN